LPLGGAPRGSAWAWAEEYNPVTMDSMTLPGAVQAIWDEMESIREQVLDEANGLRQAQGDWRAGPGEWSIGEILHHLIVAEIQTGKLTTKLVREAEAAGTLTPYPSDVARFEPLPARDAHGMQAPASVLPEPGRSLVQLSAEMRAIRTRSRESVDKLARLDPRPLVFPHFALGDLHLAQWWMLQAAHDRIHLRQIRAVKASPGFPGALR